MGGGVVGDKCVVLGKGTGVEAATSWRGEGEGGLEWSDFNDIDDSNNINNDYKTMINK